VLPSIEGRNDPELVYNALSTAFAANPNIAGIYSGGAGIRGIIRFLQDRDLPRRIAVIAHELTPLSRKALAEGSFDAIIAQDGGHLIRSAVRVLKAKCDQAEIDRSQETIRIDVFLKENMPPDTNNEGDQI
jgi:LacI family transcriptional regulator